MNTILQGDALTELRKLPDNLVQTVVTSPPYYGLRDYNVPGQIGLEATPEEFIEKLVEVFREVKRVLRHDGTLWVNMGDSYAGSGKGAGGKQEYLHEGIPSGGYRGDGYKPKDLIGIPWMLAFALRADGWYLRSDCIWAKSNAMPESVEDRPTKSHEYIFLLAKSSSYYYDADAIRESHIRYDGGYARRQSIASPNDNRNERIHKLEPHPQGRNKRSVWTIASQPYSEAHFATFPPKLIEPCILAGTSPRACEQCGAPWERQTIPTGHINKREPAHVPGNCTTKVDSTGWAPTRAATNEWKPTCKCKQEGTGKCVVLDCFMGAGTTALVALRHGRQYLGIELNPAYIALAEKRIAYVQQNLWDVAWMESEIPA